MIKNPLSRAAFDYILFPKKDIKNVGEISGEDIPYLIDAYLIAGELIKKGKLSRYRLFTNGPSFQDVSYLHFHLVSE